MGNIERIRSASQIFLSVLLPVRESVGARRVDVELLIGVAQRSGARARTAVIPSNCGLSAPVVPSQRERASSIGNATWILRGLALAMITMLAFAVTRALL
jgi:hypothetical protein